MHRRLHGGQVEEGTARAIEATTSDLARKLYCRSSAGCACGQHSGQITSQRAAIAVYISTCHSKRLMNGKQTWSGAVQVTTCRLQCSQFQQQQQTDLHPQRELWNSQMQIRIKTQRQTHIRKDEEYANAITTVRATRWSLSSFHKSPSLLLDLRSLPSLTSLTFFLKRTTISFPYPSFRRKQFDQEEFSS